jgi:hypothetical protein
MKGSVMKRLITLAAGAALACSSMAFADDAKKDANNQKATAEKTVKIKDINKRPQNWLNKKVTLHGKIEQVGADAKSFVLNGDGFFNDEILVITRSGAKTAAAANITPMFKEDNKVQVSGTIRRMKIVEVEKEYSLDLDPQIEVEFEGTAPVLVSDASDVKVIEKD